MTFDRSGSAPKTLIFWALTAAYLIAIAMGAYGLGYLDPNGDPIKPNEWGDVLAGVFSPLAFLWLIYAALSQRAELELQREELARNNETQSEQHIQMERQANALARQADRIEKEHYAQFEPIFVMQNLSAREDRAQFQLLNVGNDALEVAINGTPRVLQLVDAKGAARPSTANRLPHWPRGGTVVLLAEKVDFTRTLPLSLELTRLDLSIIRYEFKLHVARNRLFFIKRQEITEPVSKNYQTQEDE